VPDLTPKQFIFVEVCRGFLANPNFSPTPEEVVKLADRYTEVIIASLPQ
jgi:hypothetical protein